MDTDFGLSWFIFPVVIWFMMPGYALAGAVLGGVAGYKLVRRWRKIVAIALALAGSLLVPIGVMWIAEGYKRHGAAARLMTLGVLVAAGIGAAVVAKRRPGGI